MKKVVDTESKKIYNIIAEEIMSKLYIKIFPREGDYYDKNIYQKCLELSWIELYHLNILEKINVEYYLPKITQLFLTVERFKLLNKKCNYLLI